MNILLIKRLACIILLVKIITSVQFSKLTSSKKTGHYQETVADTRKFHSTEHLPSIGFGNMISGYSFLQFLQYFGDESERTKNGYSLSPEFFASILEHDPYYNKYYLFLSGSTTLYAGMPEDSVLLMNQKLKSYSSYSSRRPPGSYYIWRYKAIDELLFLGNSSAAQQSFSTAADWAAQSSDIVSTQISKISRSTSDFLVNNPDSRAAQIDAWSSLLSTALDKNTHNLAIKKIESLGGRVIFNKDGSMRIQYENTKPSEKVTGSPKT